MLPVGIHEDVVLNKVTKNDKQTLVLNFKQQGEIDPLAALSSSSQTNFEAPEQDIMVFPPNAVNFDSTEKDLPKLLGSIAELVDPLKSIAAIYHTQDNIKFDLFKNLDVTSANMEAKLKQQAVLDKVYENAVNQFIAMMTPVTGPSSKKVRLLLTRTSKAKHFPALRKKYLSSQPFIEPMDIPKTQSKLKFSKYEVENGLDKGDKVGGASTPPSADAASAAAMFAQ